MQKVKFISAEGILEMQTNEEPFVLVEALSPEQFKEGHLPHAINIPFDQTESAAPKLLPDKKATIITYCNGYLCSSSTESARIFMGMGYQKVLDFKAGKPGWKMLGLPIVKN